MILELMACDNEDDYLVVFTDMWSGSRVAISFSCVETARLFTKDCRTNPEMNHFYAGAIYKLPDKHLRRSKGDKCQKK